MKQILDLYVKNQDIDFLGENILEYLHDLGVGEEEKGTPKLGDWQWRPKREYEVEFSGQGRGRAQDDFQV